MYHIFFIHLSISGRLGFLHVLAIVNSATTSTGWGGRVSFLLRVLSEYMPRSGVVGSYGSLFFFQFFGKTSILFST